MLRPESRLGHLVARGSRVSPTRRPTCRQAEHSRDSQGGSGPLYARTATAASSGTIGPMPTTPKPPFVVWVVTVRNRVSVILATSEGAGVHRDFFTQTVGEDPADVEVQDWYVMR